MQTKLIARHLLFSSALALLLSASALSGCSTLWSDTSPSEETTDSGDAQEPTETASEEPEGPAKELTTTTTPSTDVPEAELVRTSKRLFQAGMYTLARDSFQSLREQYPMGAYSKFAELKSADACFYNAEYSTAAKRYEEFLKAYPASSDTAYIRLQAARSHLLSSRGTGRDRVPLEKALSLFDSVVTEFPGTSYATTAAHERKPVVEQLAAYDKMIIDFYAKRDNASAVAVRRKQFEDRWTSRLQESGSAGAEVNPLAAAQPAPEAAQEAVESDEAPKIETPTVVALKNEPQTDAPAAETLWEEAIKDDTQPSPESEGEMAAIPVTRIVCRPGPPAFALVVLGSQTDAAPKSIDGESLSPDDGQIEIPDLRFSSDTPEFNCLGTGDIRIDPQSGSLTVKSAKNITVSTLSNPPRLLLIPDPAT